MKKEEELPSFIQKAVLTHKYHAKKVRDNPKHRIKDTAKELKRSLGSISEDLLIADWTRSHLKELIECETANIALQFIREKKRSLLTDIEIDL